jgi:RNA-directed DNA polymerase
MNSGDITCLRYLDDFIIFGQSQKAVQAAFKRAKKLLNAIELDVYDLNDSSGKVSVGETSKRFDYLGIEFEQEILRPNKTSVDKLLREVNEIFKTGKKYGQHSEIHQPDHSQSMLGVLVKIHNKVKGWGNQYFFCNDDKLFAKLDKQIQELLESYRDNYFKKKRNLENSKNSLVQARRLLGIHVLTDSNKKPLPQFS